MPTTPNAQLTKLAIGIASVAAVAGISGKLAAQPAPVAAQPGQTTSVAAAGNTATGRTQSGALSDGGRQYQSPAFSGFGDDDEHENEEHAHSFFGSTPVQPQSGGSSTFTQPAPQTQQQAPQQQTRRTRSKHS